MTSAPATTASGRAGPARAVHAYCVTEGALTAANTAALLADMRRLAAQEVADGTDYVYDGGSNQRIWNLLRKGPLYEQLVQDAQILDVIEGLLGGEFLLSNVNANIAGPAAQAMFLHADHSVGPRPAPVPVCGPAGAAMVFDGRLWHQTGANTWASDLRHGILTYYCRPFMRQQENYWRSLPAGFADRASSRLRALLGVDHYLS